MITNIPRSDEPVTTDSKNPFMKAWFEFLNSLSVTTNKNILAVGAVSAFSTTTAPANWLECDGAAVSRTSFSALFAVIGVTYGVGDGSTTFNLPDLTGVVLVASGPISLIWMIRT